MALRLRDFNAVVLFMALTAALLLRIGPITTTGMPFDCDSWYIHRGVMILRQNPNERILSSPLYDGYNNRWPGAIFVATIVSGMTGREGLLVTHIIGPLLDALSIITFYALARKLGLPSAVYSTLLLATAPSMIGIGFGLVKETVARPLLYSLVLAGFLDNIFLILLLSLGIALTHHLSGIVASIVLLLSLPIGLLLRITSGTEIFRPKLRVSIIPVVLVTSWILAMSPPNVEAYASLLDPVSIILYTLSITSLLLLASVLVSGNPGFHGKWIPTTVIASFILIVAVRGLPPGIQATGPSILYYLYPVFLLVPITLDALSSMKRYPRTRQSSIPYTWMFVIAGITLYLALTSHAGQSPAGRMGNLMLPGILLVYAASRRWYIKWKSYMGLLVGVLYVQAVLAGTDPVSFDLPYHKYEYSAVNLVSLSGAVVYGDAKMRDLGYYLGGDIRFTVQIDNDGMYLFYRENLRYGLKLDSNLHTGNGEKIASLLTSENRVMDTGGSWIIWVP